MAIIKPFRGYRYNKDKIENLADVMAPPYDDISDEEKIKLYEMHPNNSARLVLGITHESDTQEDNCYARAAKCLEEWMDESILVRDEKPALYMYEQTVSMNEVHFTTRGIVAALKLEDLSSGTIMPCEESINNTETEKYNLLKTTNANNSMINCMYVDSDKTSQNMMAELAEEKPDMEFETKEGIAQRVWIITYEPTIQYFQKVLEDKLVYIEDGQNRYEAGLQYRDYMRNQNPNHIGDESYNYIMALLSNAREDGMVDLPVHRVVKCPKGFKEEYFVAGAQDHFKVEKIIVDTTDDELAETIKKQIATTKIETKIALYSKDNYFYRLTFKDKEYMNNLLPDKSDAYKSLDITVLNYLILDDLMGITEDKMEERVEYFHSAKNGIEAVKHGEYGCMFILNAVKSSQICEVAMNGERLPKRTLCMFPKPATGLVINKLDGNL